MLSALIGASLAVFFVWEFLLVAVPWTIPAWLQPLLVFGAALGFCWPDWRTAAAAAGGVGLLHVLVRNLGATPTPQAGAVRLRPGVGSRIPDLP